MTMPQLIDAARFSPAETLWTGDAPDGERLDDYVANEINHRPHHGETPWHHGWFRTAGPCVSGLLVLLLIVKVILVEILVVEILFFPPHTPLA